MSRPNGTADSADWLVLVDEAGERVFAFNQAEELARATWPTDDVPKQMHHDFPGPLVGVEGEG